MFSSEIPRHTREQHLGKLVLTHLPWGRRGRTSTLGETCSGTDKRYKQVMRACQLGLGDRTPCRARKHTAPCLPSP